MQDLTLMQDVDEAEKQSLSRIYSQVCLIVFIGLILSAMLFVVVLQQNTRAMESDFRHDVSVQALSLRHKTQVLKQFWDDVQSFYIASDYVREDEFLDFSKMVLKLPRAETMESNSRILFLSSIQVVKTNKFLFNNSSINLRNHLRCLHNRFYLEQNRISRV